MHICSKAPGKCTNVTKVFSRFNFATLVLGTFVTRYIHSDVGVYMCLTILLCPLHKKHFNFVIAKFMYVPAVSDPAVSPFQVHQMTYRQESDNSGMIKSIISIYSPTKICTRKEKPTSFLHSSQKPRQLTCFFHPLPQTICFK